MFEEDCRRPRLQTALQSDTMRKPTPPATGWTHSCALSIWGSPQLVLTCACKLNLKLLSTRTLAGDAPLPAVGVGIASQGQNPASGPLKFIQDSHLFLGFIFGDECRAHGSNSPVLPYLPSRQGLQGLPSTRDSSWLPICPARELMFPPTCDVSCQRPGVFPFWLYLVACVTSLMRD